MLISETFYLFLTLLMSETNYGFHLAGGHTCKLVPCQM